MHGKSIHDGAIRRGDAALGGGPAIVTLAAMAALAALTADAAARQERPAPPTEATAPRDAGEPIMAIVSIKTQQVTFYDAEGWILRAPVSTGTTGRETPAGIFAVIEKDEDHHSSLYDDAWMPNMQRITWNGIALHGGPLPGYAASHGCVLKKNRSAVTVALMVGGCTPVSVRYSWNARSSSGVALSGERPRKVASLLTARYTRVAYRARTCARSCLRACVGAAG